MVKRKSNPIVKRKAENELRPEREGSAQKKLAQRRESSSRLPPRNRIARQGLENEVAIHSDIVFKRVLRKKVKEKEEVFARSS